MNINYIFKEMYHRSQHSDTGLLQIREVNSTEKPWSLYFSLGRLIWASGGKHEQRRIYRQLSHCYPHNLVELFQFTHNLEIDWKAESAYYDLLSDLFKVENKISINQFILIANQIKLEVLFDLLQVIYLESQVKTEQENNKRLQHQWFENVRPTKYIPVPREVAKSTEELIQTAQQQWEQWQKSGLGYCLPNQAPIIEDATSIQQATAAKTFQTLKRLLTGKRTLRDIAIETKRDIVSITKVFWEYYQQGWLTFQDVPDLNLPEIVSKRSVTNSSSETTQRLLVACVDDSPQVTQTLEQFIRDNGYDFIGINDPLRANATLLKTKPDLIFLDLIMPNTNGYEICTQLRRVSSLKEIPIIILTGKDGLIDRMRAKMVGATHYLSKPVQRTTILEVLQKYLSPAQSHEPDANSGFSSG
jgi:chemotaxis family two-component system response regulator PixG